MFALWEQKWLWVPSPVHKPRTVLAVGLPVPVPGTPEASPARGTQDADGSLPATLAAGPHAHWCGHEVLKARYTSPSAPVFRHGMQVSL